MNNGHIYATSFSDSRFSTPISPFLHGASPTTYMVGNLMWNQLAKLQLGQKTEIGKGAFYNGKYEASEGYRYEKEVERLPRQPSLEYSYSELHMAPFMEMEEVERTIQISDNTNLRKINARDHNGNTPIIWAAAQGKFEVVELLIDQGADVKIQNFAGETALFMAAAEGYDQICRLLVEHGANPNQKNLDGATPAHIAAAGGHIAVLEVLATHGAYMNQQDDEGDTPLHWAVRESRLKAVEYLVSQCNAQVDLRNESQETPLQLASILEETEMVEFLRRFSPEAMKDTEYVEGNWMVSL
jgi:ankyrin repeat protein